jgi:hypothetical protein
MPNIAIRRRKATGQTYDHDLATKRERDLQNARNRVQALVDNTRKLHDLDLPIITAEEQKSLRRIHLDLLEILERLLGSS